MASVISDLEKKHDKNGNEYYFFSETVDGSPLMFNIYSRSGMLYELNYRESGRWIKKRARARIVRDEEMDLYQLGCFQINGDYYEITLLWDGDFCAAEAVKRNDLVQSATKIADCLSDYENGKVSIESVLSWSVQFGEDAGFILDETACFIDKIYFSEKRIESVLEKWILELREQFDSWDSFLKEVLFINTQGGEDDKEKSQNALYWIISGIIENHTGKRIADFDDEDKYVFVYADDILASGGTLRTGVRDSIKQYDCKDKQFCCWIVCCHSVQMTKTINDIVLDQTDSFRNSPFKTNFQKNFRCEYVIENGRREFGVNSYDGQLFNCIEPLDSDLSREIMSGNALYGSPDGVHLLSDSEIAEERFFSSKDSRKRYTEIMLMTSAMLNEEFLSLPSMEKKDKRKYKPLGVTNRTDKSLGLGTLYVTWRNIPNNCPFAFWGDVNG